MKFYTSLLCAALVFFSQFVIPASADVDTGAAAVQVRVQTPLYHLSPTALDVPGYARSNVPGAPSLPVYGTLVKLPATGVWTISVSDAGVVELPEPVTLPPTPTTVPPAPQSYGLSGSRRADASVLTSTAPDPTIYGRNAFYPASVIRTGQEQWQRGERLLPIQVFPFQYNPVTHRLMYHPDLQIVVRTAERNDPASLGGQPGTRASTVGAAGKPSSPLSELGALLVRTQRRGMHRLTYSDLTGAGIDISGIDPNSFLMTYLGQPVRILVTGAADGRFDPGDLVIFYAEPYLGRWSSTNVYRLSFGATAAPRETRMDERTVTPSGQEPVVTTITQTLHIERNTQYYSEYWISTEADHIFDDPLTPSASNRVVTRSYDLPLDDPASGQMSISGLLYGGQEQSPNPDEWAKLKVNSHDAAEYTWDGRNPYTITATVAPMAWLDQPVNQLNLVADLNQLPGLSTYWYNPDWLNVSYPAYADAEADHIEIEGFEGADASVQLRVTGFSSADVRAFDVRDPRNPVQLLTTQADQLNQATQITVWDAWGSGDPSPSYSLSTDAALFAPLQLSVDTPSSWKSPNHEADYIAIVHRSLWDAIDPLLNLRTAQGHEVAKVDVQDIYDEFNDGQLHQQAIRDFLAYAYSNWNAGGPRPKYVLLVGDATWDFKNQFGTNMKVLVPAFLGNFDPWMVETASDSRFVSFDGPDDRLPEMLIGRIPAQTPGDVAAYVNKVLAYENKSTNPDGAWQNQVAYIADDDANSAGNFHAMSDDLRLNWLPSYYTSTAVYYNPTEPPAGGYTKPAAMKSGIKQAFNDGQVFLQWFGHASKYRWGSVSGIWNTDDPINLNANNRMPFVAAFSCLEGYFINIDSDDYHWSNVLGEQHLVEPGRGSIGGLSPSGKHVGSALTVLDQGLTKSIFQDRIAGTGEAVDAAKRYYLANATGWMDVLDTSIFFGDPALTLRLPLPPAIAPALNISTGTGASVNLTWLHREADTSYRVWRGVSPYFDAESEGIQLGTVDAAAAGYEPGTIIPYSDDGVGPPPPVTILGDPANNYYWLVRGANWRGVSADSNRVGEFDFALIPGGNP